MSAAKKIVFPFTPQETQARAAEALSPYSKVKVTGYGGPKFGGKSWTIQYIAALHLLSRPVNILIIGHEYDSLKGLHVDPLKRLLKDYIDNGLVKWNSNDKQFTCLKYGSIVKFKQIARDSDAMSLNGQRWDIVLIDEAQKLSPFSLSYLLPVCGFSPTASDWKKRLTMEYNAAVAAGDIAKQKEVTDVWEKTYYYPKMLYCFNWGEKGHSHLKRWFWDGCPHELDPVQRIDAFTRDPDTGKLLEDPEEFQYIFADMTKNQVGMESDPGYVKQLQGLVEPYRSAYIKGDPNAFSGMKYQIHPIYHEIDFDEYLILRGYKDELGAYLPDEWGLYASIDSGVTCSASLYARTHDGKSFQISDYYQEGDARLHIREIIAGWRRNPWTRGRMPDIVFGDRYLFAKRDQNSLAGNTLTWAYILENEYGLFCHPALSDRVTGAMAVGMALHYETNDEGKITEEPRVFFAKRDTGKKDADGHTVYKRICEPTITEIISLESDPKQVEDIKHDAGIADHAFDKMKIYLVGMSDPPQIPNHHSPSHPNSDGFGGTLDSDALSNVEEAEYSEINEFGGGIGDYGA